MGRRKSRLPELNPKYPPMEIGSEQHHDVCRRWDESKWRSNWGQVNICLRQTVCVNFGGLCASCFKHSRFQPKKIV